MYDPNDKDFWADKAAVAAFYPNKIKDSDFLKEIERQLHALCTELKDASIDSNDLLACLKDVTKYRGILNAMVYHNILSKTNVSTDKSDILDMLYRVKGVPYSFWQDSPTIKFIVPSKVLAYLTGVKPIPESLPDGGISMEWSRVDNEVDRLIDRLIGEYELPLKKNASFLYQPENINLEKRNTIDWL